MITIETAKRIMTAEKTLPNYLSWLEYKKQSRIVRYYPTERMFENYIIFSKAIGKHCFGENMELSEGHKLLLDFLEARLLIKSGYEKIFNL